MSPPLVQFDTKENEGSYQFTQTVCGFKHVEDVWMLIEQFSNKRRSGSVPGVNDELIPDRIVSGFVLIGVNCFPVHTIRFLHFSLKRKGNLLDIIVDSDSIWREQFLVPLPLYNP